MGVGWGSSEETVANPLRMLYQRGKRHCGEDPADSRPHRQGNLDQTLDKTGNSKGHLEKVSEGKEGGLF